MVIGMFTVKSGNGRSHSLKSKMFPKEFGILVYSFTFLCRRVSPACMSANLTCTCLGGQRRALDTGTRIIDNFEPPWGCRELSLGSPCVQSVL